MEQLKTERQVREMPRKPKRPLQVACDTQLTLAVAHDPTETLAIGVAPPVKAPMHVVIDAFHTRYVDAYGVAPLIPGKLLPALKKLVAASGASEALRRLDVLFDGHGPRWLKPPYDLGTYISQYDKLVVAGGRAKPSELLRATVVIGKVTI